MPEQYVLTIQYRTGKIEKKYFEDLEEAKKTYDKYGLLLRIRDENIVGISTNFRPN